MTSEQQENNLFGITQPVEKNPRGIPKAPFITDVEEYLGGPDADVEPPLKVFSDAIAKYRYMNGNLIHRRRVIEEKIPDVKKALAVVEFLRDRRASKSKADEDDDMEDELDGDGDEKKPLRTTFGLNDTLFAEAELHDTDEVYLWLGANVMLSYKIPAAIELLKSKLEAAQTSLDNANEDLEFTREQLTVMEVNTARVYNWDVKRRREKRERDDADGRPRELERG